MWQRQRTPRSSLLLQSLEKLGVMHHSPSLFSSLCLSVPPHCFCLYPSINSAPFSADALSRVQTRASSPRASCSYLSPFFHRNSLKGGISKSTNGRDLIGKCEEGGWGRLLSAAAAGVGRTLEKGAGGEKKKKKKRPGEKMQMPCLEVSWCCRQVAHYETPAREVGEFSRGPNLHRHWTPTGRGNKCYYVWAHPLFIFFFFFPPG